MRVSLLSLLSVSMLMALCRGDSLTQKNIIDVPFEAMPGDYHELLKRDATSWNFNFRPYDKHSAQELWTDPNVIRDALDGINSPGEAPTAIRVSCDQFGICLLVFAGDPDLAEAQREGKLPRSTIELFFEPGLSESGEIGPYYQMVVEMMHPKSEFHVFDWLTETTDYRSLKKHLVLDRRFLANGVVMRLLIPWEPLFDRLPLDEVKNRIWRLSVIRWGAKGGGQTWGGPVHSHSGAGYIRFPEFTEEQKHAIRKQILQSAWCDFHAVLKEPDCNPELVERSSDSKSMGRQQRSYMNYNEDFGFRDFWLEEAVAERLKLGSGIAGFDQMKRRDQELFYQRAAERLFNFRHALEAAYGRYMRQKLFDSQGEWR